MHGEQNIKTQLLFAIEPPWTPSVLVRFFVVLEGL